MTKITLAELAKVLKGPPASLKQLKRAYFRIRAGGDWKEELQNVHIWVSKEHLALKTLNKHIWNHPDSNLERAAWENVMKKYK